MYEDWVICTALEVLGGGLQIFFELQKQRNTVRGFYLLSVLKCSLTELSTLCGEGFDFNSLKFEGISVICKDPWLGRGKFENDPVTLMWVDEKFHNLLVDKWKNIPIALFSADENPWPFPILCSSG
jgi:hypothetical protein